MPDIEVRTQTYPFATIDLTDIRQAKDRQMSGMVYDNDKAGAVLPEAGVIYSYEYPVTYDLYYQITTYSRHLAMTVRS